MAERDLQDPRFRRYELTGGWIVLAGRTDADNEYLSLRFARPHEHWFHAHGCPGSHVLLVHQDDLEPGRDELRAAAAVAAWHSKARNASKVPVTTCKAADIGKQRGSPRGQVTVRREKQVKVKPGLPGGSPGGE